MDNTSYSSNGNSTQRQHLHKIYLPENQVTNETKLILLMLLTVLSSQQLLVHTQTWGRGTELQFHLLFCIV
jgi:hypothetical protein